MDIFQASATIGLRAFALPPGTLSANANQQGLAAFQTSFPDADVAYSRRFKLGFEGEAVDLILSDGTYTEGFGLPEIAGVPEGAPYYARVIGTLSDGTNPLPTTILLKATGAPVEAFGLLIFTLTDTGDPLTGSGTEYALGISRTISTGAVLANLTKVVDGVVTAEWTAPLANNSWDITGAVWTAVSPATGTPVFQDISFSKSFDPSGKDLYGEDIPTMGELYGILVECLSGSIIGRTGDEYVELTAGEKRLSANVNSLESLLDTMEIEAVTNSDVRVTVIGKSA